MTLRRLLTFAVAAVAAVTAVTACDDGAADPVDDTTTAPAGTVPGTSAVVTDPPTTTTTPATTTTTTADPTTTTPAPTTSPDDALKAQIAANYDQLRSTRYFELVQHTEPGQARGQRAQLPLRPAPAFYAAVVARVQQLVALGDAVVPNDPDILPVDCRDRRAGRPLPANGEALVTVCEVTNRRTGHPG